ncbi:putative disease resistance protein RGA3 [Silene latifolia]|uniref:putative disease resistance protein RGA3 n=1 Tax=Silene latifolia TaxID=37657 RepID=UPI003D780631
MALEFVSGFILSSLLQEVVDRIKASVADKLALAYSDVEKELKSLESTYVKALSILDSVDGWDLITSKRHADWVADVRRACFDIEDFTEHIKIEILKKGDTAFLRSYWTSWGLSSKIQDLKSNLNDCTSRSHQFVASKSRLVGQTHLRLTTEPLILLDDDSFLRKTEKETIIKVLLRPATATASFKNSSIILIAGMFGLGKTTLIQKVKNDSRIQRHFDHRLWVSVSGEFNLGKVLGSLIVDLELDDPRLSVSLPVSEQKYIGMFQGLSKGKRVLVVLDDVCNFERVQDWEDFQSVMLSSCSEFGVLITTRNPKVATVVASFGSIPTVCHYLQKISDQDCGLILEKKGKWEGNRRYCEAKRERNGKRILEGIAVQLAERFCRGLPLVADVMGRHITLKREDRLLELFKDIWDIPECTELIFPHFRLNYSDFSVFMKNCFPYFALFPDGYSFSKDGLIRLWIAEGYIKPYIAGVGFSENSDLEEVGKYHFDEVLSKSVLQIYHPFDQEPLVYQIHEFIHRYSTHVGSDLYLQLDGERYVDDSVESAWRFKKIRHLSLLCRTIPSPVWKHIEKFCDGLRTILCLQEFICLLGEVRYTLFLKLQSLRVLNLSGTDISKLPESVGKLEHLRLLDVSKTDIQELPESISDLSELRFLKVDQCPMLLQLPKKLKNLTQLLRLEADMKGLSLMPESIGKLGNLRTLSAFIVGRKDGFRVTELKDMKYLQGSICLVDLENVADKEEAMSAMIGNKPFLKRLELEWNQDDHPSVSEEILDGFEPNENLEELQVTGFDGARFPKWLSSRECKLTRIQLVRCEKCIVLPELGRLQHLKSLQIEELHSVKHIDDRFSGFPSLESLAFRDMTSLEKWVGVKSSEMPCLRDLIISDCPNLVSLPCLNLMTRLSNFEITCCPVAQALPDDILPPSLQTLIIVRSDLLKRRCLPGGGDWEKIKNVPKVMIDFTQVSTSW